LSITSLSTLKLWSWVSIGIINEAMITNQRSSEGTQTSGIRAVKYEPQIDLPININKKQSINLIYQINQLKDVAQIERVAGGCVEVDYPVDNISEYTYLQYIESQFAARNASNFDRELIDRTICDLIPYCLRQEGFQLPDETKDAARMKALIFKQVRGFSSDKKMADYLVSKPYFAQLFDCRSDCIDVSSTTYTKIRDKYELCSQSVRNSICRLQHILFRNGILDTLSDDQNIVGRAIPLGKTLPNHLRSRALINWGELLLEQLVEDISFGRVGETYSIREIIAAVANITLDQSLEKSYNLAQLKYKNNIISHDQIRNIIYENISEENFLSSKQEIESIAMELHRNLFKFAANEVGFFSKPLDIAIDPTWISIEEKMDYNKVPGAMGNIKLEADGGFQFATGVSFTPKSKFSLGVSLVTDKSTLAKVYRRMLLALDEFADVGWILADREFDNPESIELARTRAGKTWIIRLRDHKEIVDNIEYRKLKKEGKAMISVGDIQVNAFWRDISTSDYDWVFEDDDENLILMSGLPLDDANISYLAGKYPKRWSAETHIRQLKHSFSPQITNKYAFDHLFFLNISSIFYNIWKMINQSLSPTYGLPLQPRYYEVLWALAHSTFQCRCQGEF